MRVYFKPDLLTYSKTGGGWMEGWGAYVGYEKFDAI